MNPFSRISGLILASQSPRRQQLLKEAGFVFSVRPAGVDETLNTEIPLTKAVEELARRKAAATSLKEGELVIAADTIVVKNRIVFEKPLNRDDAIRFLEELSGSEHEVITGVCLHSFSKQISFHEVTKVSFSKLSIDKIEFYVDCFQPYDKAGGYAIQEWIGLIGVEKIEGCYFNVVGLPLNRLVRELEHF